MIDRKLRDELHEELLAERRRIGHEVATLARTGVSADAFQENESDAYDQHPADAASELFEREKNLTLIRTLEASLQEIAEALRKFDEGTYGVCGRCGKPIGEKRLRALPEATHCIDCQNLLEREAQIGMP